MKRCDHLSLLLQAPSSMAVGQNQWYHFGVGAPPILVYFSGDWDVHWGASRAFDPWPYHCAVCLAFFVLTCEAFGLEGGGGGPSSEGSAQLWRWTGRLQAFDDAFRARAQGNGSMDRRTLHTLCIPCVQRKVGGGFAAGQPVQERHVQGFLLATLGHPGFHQTPNQKIRSLRALKATLSPTIMVHKGVPQKENRLPKPSCQLP